MVVVISFKPALSCGFFKFNYLSVLTYSCFLLQIDNVLMDDNWKKLLDLVGVSDEQRQTKETMEFIYDFVEKRGGIERVTRELEGVVCPPSLPSRDLGDYLLIYLHVIKEN